MLVSKEQGGRQADSIFFPLLLEILSCRKGVESWNARGSHISS